jgi:uracil-DNA glycosylase
VPPTKEERREALKDVYHQAKGCTHCPQLAATRTTVVFGNGNADADLMFVGEAPGANEDRQGLPFVGQAGRLLDTLLGEIGLTRPDVFVANVLKCRPPGNRDPHPAEIEACQEYLLRQVELIAPRVICTLGNFATKLLRGDPTGITRLHGREEVRVIGRRAVRLYPIFHPAAALYTPANVEVLRADFARLPELLALDPPPQPDPVEEPAVPVGGEDEPVPRAVPEPERVGPAAEHGHDAVDAGREEGAGDRDGEPEPGADAQADADAEVDADADEHADAGADAEADADGAERELEPVAVQLGLF